MIFSRITAGRRGVPGSNMLLAMLGVTLLLILNGCAKSSDLTKERETNLIQEKRIAALERDIQTSLTIYGQRLKVAETLLKSLKGNILLIDRDNKKIVSEQEAIREGQERTLFGQRKMDRTASEASAKMARFRLEAENDLDKIRTRLGQIEALMKSSLANLPSKSLADKAFREAHFLIVSGEMDLAADQFASFIKRFPKDQRRVEALYRRGQALFLLRKYDHAMIPFFQVVEKSPKHKLALSARWMLARALEETGDLRLARDFYAQLITEKTPYANDASRRVAFINKLFPRGKKKK